MTACAPASGRRCRRRRRRPHAEEADRRGPRCERPARGQRRTCKRSDGPLRPGRMRRLHRGDMLAGSGGLSRPFRHERGRRHANRCRLRQRANRWGHGRCGNHRRHRGCGNRRRCSRCANRRRHDRYAKCGTHSRYVSRCGRSPCTSRCRRSGHASRCRRSRCVQCRRCRRGANRPARGYQSRAPIQRGERRRGWAGHGTWYRSIGRVDDARRTERDAHEDGANHRKDGDERSRADIRHSALAVEIIAHPCHQCKAASPNVSFSCLTRAPRRQNRQTSRSGPFAFAERVEGSSVCIPHSAPSNLKTLTK